MRRGRFRGRARWRWTTGPPTWWAKLGSLAVPRVKDGSKAPRGVLRHEMVSRQSRRTGVATGFMSRVLNDTKWLAKMMRRSGNWDFETAVSALGGSREEGDGLGARGPHPHDGARSGRGGSRGGVVQRQARREEGLGAAHAWRSPTSWVTSRCDASARLPVKRARNWGIPQSVRRRGAVRTGGWP